MIHIPPGPGSDWIRERFVNAPTAVPTDEDVRAVQHSGREQRMIESSAPQLHADWPDRRQFLQGRVADPTAEQAAHIEKIVGVLQKYAADLAGAITSGGNAITDGLRLGQSFRDNLTRIVLDYDIARAAEIEALKAQVWQVDPIAVNNFKEEFYPAKPKAAKSIP